MREVLLLIIALLFSVPWVSGQTTSGGWTYTLNGVGEATITAYSGMGGSVIIPDTVDGYEVKTLGDGSFPSVFGGWPNTAITSVVIPKGVTSIGQNAFQQCISLTSVSIPDTMKSIGQEAFSGCQSLTSVTIPNSVTNIGINAFANCVSLANVTIPDSLISVEDGTFFNCKSLTNVTMPNSVTSIGSNAFSYCSALTSLTVPDGVTSIGSYAFYGCKSLTSVTVGSSVNNIGYEAFSDSVSLISVYFLGNAPSIDGSLFNGISLVGTVYYVAGKTGWGTTFSGWPTQALTLIDSDGDGLLDDVETNTGTFVSAFDTGTSPNNPDTDGDEISDGLEVTNKLNPLVDDRAHDTDSDGLHNAAEFFLSALGFNWQVAQTSLVGILLSNAHRANLFSVEEYGANYTNGQTAVLTNPSVFGLFTQEEYERNFTNGQTSVATNPWAFNLFTAEEYWAAYTNGLSEGYTNGMNTGVGDVLSDPSNYSLYTEQQYNQSFTNGIGEGISNVINNPTKYGLYSAQQYHESFTNGIAEGIHTVTNNASSYGLYTSESIMDLRMDGAMVPKQNGVASVSIQPTTTTNLMQPFTNNGLPITFEVPMPNDRAFMRIEVKTQSPLTQP